LRSIRSSSRARTNSQRGFALIAAVVLAILYVALIELLLLDSARELGEARRFRAKVVAATLAENGAELAAASMLTQEQTTANETDAQGTMFGRMTKTGSKFEIHGEGSTTGLVRTSARVQLTGRIEGNKVMIDYAVHAP
jgi:hypothetical protein